MILDGTYSDLVLKLSKEETLDVHKCILSCRSFKFDQLFEKSPKIAEMDLSEEVKGKTEIFKLLIHFLYSGEVIFPGKADQVFELLKLSYSYSVKDLVEFCEDDIVHKLNENNLLEMIIKLEKSDLISESTLEKCRTLFIKSFPSICNENPNVEERLTEVPGLMKNLLLHVSSKKKFKRKVTFMNFEV